MRVLCTVFILFTILLISKIINAIPIPAEAEENEQQNIKGDEKLDLNSKKSTTSDATPNIKPSNQSDQKIEKQAEENNPEKSKNTPADGEKSSASTVENKNITIKTKII